MQTIAPNELPYPAPLPQLDPHETKAQEPLQVDCEGVRTATELDLAFRHSGWHVTRERIFRALSSTAAGVARLQRFACCGTGCWIQRSLDDPRRYRLSANYCRDRFCVPCCKAAAQVVGHNLQAHTKRKTIRFLTLTKLNLDMNLSEAIDSLNSSFRRLRNRKAWKTHVEGGVAFLEVKWSETPGRWNAHLHILIEGKYWDKSEISSEWNQATGDSFIIDIRTVPPGKGIVNYIVKYATKAIDNKTTHNPPRLREAIVSLHGRRTCSTFGSWRGLKLYDSKPEGEWDTVMSLADCIRANDRGDVDAAFILDSIRKDKPWTKSLHERSPPVNPCGGDSSFPLREFPTAPSAESRSTNKPSTSPATSPAACVASASTPSSGPSSDASSRDLLFSVNG